MTAVKSRRWLAVLFWSGLLTTLFCANLVGRDAAFLLGSESAQGEVISFVQVPCGRIHRQSGRRATCTTPQVRFQPDGHSAAVFDSPVASSFQFYELGEKVEVRYRPEDPARARIFDKLASAPWIVGAVGLLMVLLTATPVWRLRAHRRRALQLRALGIPGERTAVPLPQPPASVPDGLLVLPMDRGFRLQAHDGNRQMLPGMFVGLLFGSMPALVLMLMLRDGAEEGITGDQFAAVVGLGIMIACGLFAFLSSLRAVVNRVAVRVQGGSDGYQVTVSQGPLPPWKRRSTIVRARGQIAQLRFLEGAPDLFEGFGESAAHSLVQLIDGLFEP